MNTVVVVTGAVVDDPAMVDVAVAFTAVVAVDVDVEDTPVVVGPVEDVSGPELVDVATVVDAPVDDGADETATLVTVVGLSWAVATLVSKTTTESVIPATTRRARAIVARVALLNLVVGGLNRPKTNANIIRLLQRTTAPRLPSLLWLINLAMAVIGLPLS